MRSSRSAVLVGIVLGPALACGRGDGVQVLREAAAQADAIPTPPAVAFRFPPTAGPGVVLYELPSLREIDWHFNTPDLAAERVVGFAPDEDLVFVQTAADALVALDLVSGADAVLDTSVISAALGPTGLPHYVRTDGSISVVRERRPDGWSPTMSPLPSLIWGTTRGRLVSLLEDDAGRELSVIEDDTVSQRFAIPDGLLAATPWGDLVAVATDSGVVTYGTDNGEVDAFREIDDDISAMAFSRAGHRLYLATVAGEMLELNRYGLDVLRTQTLGAVVEAMRVGPTGEVVLLKPVGRDSIWVARPPNFTEIVRVAGTWEADLPAMGSNGTILVRHGNDIVALDARTGRELGGIPDAAEDRWLIVEWDPRRPTSQVVEDDEPDLPRGDQRVYVQLASTSNESWAQARADELRAAGLQARVLYPSGYEDRYRVVLGPFGRRDEADDIGRRLGQPYFLVVNPDSTAENR